MKFIIIIIGYLIIRNFLRRKLIEERLNRLYGYTKTGVLIEDFVSHRDEVMKHQVADKSYNKPGVYIFHNHTLNKYYVGQGVRVHDRVNDHISGRGNGDIYADMKYGSTFTVSIHMLPKGTTLNTMEREFIESIGQHHELYNKTKGNRG